MRRITVFIPSFDHGGVEKMMLALASGFCRAGFATDLVTRPGPLPYLGGLDPAVQRIPVDSPRADLVRYLRSTRPAVVLSAKEDDDRIALHARDVAAVGTRVFLRCGTHLSSRPKLASANLLRRWWHRRRLRRQFVSADGVVCISEGVADDVALVTGLPRGLLHVIHNPVVTPWTAARLEEPCPHPWLAPGQRPVVLAAGRLATVKRFDDLLRAAAPLLLERQLRLVILGEGKWREPLLRLAERLGVRTHVDLPGFVDNVLPYMRRATVFVHPSEREGYGNVLAEALLCGTPVVATDCPTGPREILAGGRYGPLVPVGDVRALREAIASVLDHPLSPDTLRGAVAWRTLERTCRGYLTAFGLSSPDTASIAAGDEA